MSRFRPLAMAVLFAAVSAAPARADGFITPFLGFNFGGDQSASCASLTNCQDKRSNWGVALGATNGVFGFEEEIGYTQNFFGVVPGGDNAVLTLMSNLMVTVIPAGPVQPYGVVGLGLMRPHFQLDATALAVDQNALGYDIGGGVNLYFVPNIGIRGDVRHLHTLQDITLGVFSNQKLEFWRASAGLTLRF